MNPKSKIVLHPYIPAAVNRVEKWLEQEAREGWQLSKKVCCSFEFIKCHPYESKYFMCKSFDSSKGISFDYHMAKKRYAKTRTQLNKGNASLFEVDIKKIDNCFGDYIFLRNKFYIIHYLKLFAFALISFACSTILFNISGLMLTWIVTWVILFVYSIVSLIILYRDGKQMRNHE